MAKNNSTFYDLAIVGGGITGLLVAYYAQKKGIKTVLLEKDRIGLGATYYAAALCELYQEKPAKNKASARSMNLWEKLEEDLGVLFFKKTPYKLLLPQHKSPLNAKEGIPRLSSVAWPPILNRDLITSHHCYESDAVRSVDPHTLIGLLKRAITSSPNTIIMEGIMCKKIDSTNDVAVLQHLQGCISAKHVALTLGPWTNMFIDQQGWSKLPLRLKQVTSLHLTYKGALPFKDLYHFWEEDAFCLPQEEKNRIVLSIRDPNWDVIPNKNITLRKEHFIQGEKIFLKFFPTLSLNII